MRKLASIREIGEIAPIEGADRIEVVTVDGWQCVAKKGEFEVGDLGVYFEIDSFLPHADERFHFLKPFIKYDGKDGVRLRTVRLRGQISQGLMLPLKNFPEFANAEVGDDVTEQLGVTLWERPLPTSLGGNAKGNFPHFIRKTEQERVQNMKRHLAKSHGMSYEVSIKLDGSSMTAYLHEGEFGVCSRNLDLVETEGNTFWQVARSNKIEDMLRALGKNFAMQGELMGPGIQGNIEEFTKHRFFLYDIYDIAQQQYLSPSERMMEVNKLQRLGFDLECVPVIDDDFILGPEHSVVELLAYAEGPSYNANTQREGLVFKRSDGAQSFKVIANSYLLKEK